MVVFLYSLEPYYNFLLLLLQYASFTIFSYQFFGSAHYIIRYRDIIPNARERIMIFSFRYYSFLLKFEFLKFCSKNGGSVKEILMIPTPIVTFLFASLCSFVWLFSSRFRRSYFKFTAIAAISLERFWAWILLEYSRAFHSVRDSFSGTFFRTF